ncbi:3-dehydroquinate synthase [candidate division WOR-1 bacterium RIFCSPHIGHO2_01_FULL_53_15]|uniref:3-dehydroquinate synthase n=1 Tax=candidate division WOR-1 bacterium RIFCSPHIGHO2_01_FULL_53_15 TaxID=1802564 RepID=A0A1F4Q2X6_UNCSA|nr:MAG: 3-dehydroquinate synthase [candidate division WOR-1 bacterium RIFCSPHIGHO2_01_FULL_53_15]
MAKIKVELKERSYDIIIGCDNLAELGGLVRDEQWGRDVFIITDPLINDLYGDTVRKGFKTKPKTFEIPRGERYKNLRVAEKLYDDLARVGAHRDSLIIALGGGVIGDLAGFVAATYMRGINYIQVPTTLLAQVDAAIGGKTGVNHPKAKNLIGAFYQPKAVFIDVGTIATLPARELRTGLAEVIKYGVIEDADFFKFLEANAHHLNTKAFENEDTKRAALKLWQTIVTESAKIKAKIVEKDEKEAGLRMILNFGHTVGHAIESLTRYRAYNHGEAVAIGMTAAAMIASGLKLLSADDVKRLKELLDKLGLPTEIKDLPLKKILSPLELDKKVIGGKVNFVLPEKLGKVVIKDDVSLTLVKQVLKEIGAK